MLEETCISRFATTHEFTALSIQTIHNWNGMGTVKPLACLNRHESRAPCYSAVPKAGHSEDPSRGRSEFQGKLSLGCSARAGPKGVFPTTPEWNGLGTCGGCQAEKAECVK